MALEISLSLLSFALAAYFFIASLGIKVSSVLAENSVFFPLAMAVFLTFLGLVQLRITLRSAKEIQNIPLGTKKIWMTVGLMTAYLILLPFAGYLISSILFSLAFCVLFSIHKEKAYFGIVSFAIPLAVFLVFRFALKVALP